MEGNLNPRGEIMKKLIVIMALLVLAGCSDISVKRENTFYSNEINSHNYIKSYVLGEKKTTFIGDPIIKWQEISIKNTEITKMFAAKSDFELKGLYKGKGWSRLNVQLKANKADEFYYFGKTNYKGIEYSVIGINKDADDNLSNFLITNNGILNKYTVVDNELNDSLTAEKPYSSPDEIVFLEAPIKSKFLAAGMSREVIFGGVNNVTLNATYREYTPDDMARQAFSQNLVYQTTAETIRFRGFKIKVHEVTNEKITYTVLEDGLNVPAVVNN